MKSMNKLLLSGLGIALLAAVVTTPAWAADEPFTPMVCLKSQTRGSSNGNDMGTFTTSFLLLLANSTECDCIFPRGGLEAAMVDRGA